MHYQNSIVSCNLGVIKYLESHLKERCMISSDSKPKPIARTRCHIFLDVDCHMIVTDSDLSENRNNGQRASDE